MEKVLSVTIQMQKDDASGVRTSLDELRRLVETAGGEVIDSEIQKRDRPDPATFIGKGKVEELAERGRRLGLQTFVFDQELKPAQQRNLEELLNAKVVDRTRLILDIFAQRARTREGKLQVELAQLNYFLPRLTERFGRFEQQTGGIGARGPGERKLEVDQRRIRDRMALLGRQIEKIRNERALQRSVRRSIPVPQTALVGYTNAGKSTLLNKLLKMSAGAPHAKAHEVYADDKLFATLDPTTRRVRMPSGRVMLFSDTVGFIRKLPTELVAAFRATLEEVATADLLIHVVDASDPNWQEQESTVVALLTKLDMQHLPRLTAYNKMDRLSARNRQIFDHLEGIPVSAATGKGIKDLLTMAEEQLSHEWVEKDLLFGYDEGARLAQLYRNMDVLSKKSTARGIQVRVRTHPTTLAQWMAPKNKGRNE